MIKSVMVRAVTRDFFDFNDRFRFARGELRGFTNDAAKAATISRTRIRRPGAPEYRIVNLTLPNTIWGDPVTSIGEGAFRNILSSSSCYTRPSRYRLNISIPYGVVSIGANAFRANSGLVNIAIPNNVTYIGERAFYARMPTPPNRNRSYRIDNYSIESITIGANVVMAENSFRRYRRSYGRVIGGESITVGGGLRFPNTYNENGKRAGAYTWRGYRRGWAHSPQ